MATDDLAFTSALDLAAMLRKRDMSPVELTQLYLDRIERFDTVRMHKDGSRVDVSLTISPIKNSEGEVVGASKTAFDVTSRKQAEDRFRFLADASSALVALVDYQSTMQRIARMAVPFFADWCFVDGDFVDGGAGLFALVAEEQTW